jgi:hypothetical protein
MIIKQGYLYMFVESKKVIDYHHGKYKEIDINKNWESIQIDELYDLYHFLMEIDKDYSNGIEPYTKEPSKLCCLLYRDNQISGKVADGYVTKETMQFISKYLQYS